MCLLDNREVRKGWQPLKDAVTGLFTKHGAKILSSRRWDERRLAYPIRGQHRGTYLLIYFAADTQALAAIRRDMQFNEAVMRSLLVDCAEVPQTAYEPEAAFDVNAIPADDAPPAPEPEPVVEAEPVAPETPTEA
jgi:ribosomal protein S6